MAASNIDHPDLQDAFSPYEFPVRWQTTIGTTVILILVYYVWPVLSHETTIKRQLYEMAQRIIPARFTSIVAKSASKIARLPPTSTSGGSDASTARSSSISSVVQRATSISGFDKFVQPVLEATYAGLGNWDNSCFQNSVLQGLGSMQAFSDFVKVSTHSLGRSAIDARTFEGLNDFLSQLQQEREGRHTLWPPAVLRSMNTWQQQDAQEYYSKIMDAVEKESAKYYKSVARQSSPSLTCLRDDDTKMNVDGLRATIDHGLPSIAVNPVEGTLSQTLRCQKCGFSEGLSMMAFNCLTLNLGLAGGRYLEDLIDSYTEAELIDGVECENCTKLAQSQLKPTQDGETDSTQPTQSPEAADVKPMKVLSTKAKRIQFGRLPRNLVIHLNRSIYDEYGNQRKNTAYVQIPERLEIVDEWVASLSSNEPDIHAVYELKCLVTHQGRHDNGHYVACGRRGKEWFSFNDEIVTKIDVDSVLSRGHGFMLFYEQIEQASVVQIAELGLATPQETFTEALADQPESTAPTSDASIEADNSALSNSKELEVEIDVTSAIEGFPSSISAGEAQTANEQVIESADHKSLGSPSAVVT